ncbi:MAG: TPM domain-containing protein [Vicingaceae bacterium]
MTSRIFTSGELAHIKVAIEDAEKNTSGEIRVHIEKHCKEDVLDRAAGVFDMLKMQRTEQRNGVLFYLATSDHKFAIIGDAGINSVVPDDFWNAIKSEMSDLFKAGKFAEGLEKGIAKAGQQLKSHFPYESGDKNELSDEISFGS